MLNPEQRAALRDWLTAGDGATECAAMIATRNDVGIATVLGAQAGVQMAPPGVEIYATRRTVAARSGGPGALALHKMRAFAATIADTDPEPLQELKAITADAMHYVDERDGVDMAHPHTHLMLDALVSVAVLTEGQANALKAIGLLPRTRGEVLFGAVVQHEDVSAALNGGAL